MEKENHICSSKNDEWGNYLRINLDKVYMFMRKISKDHYKRQK